MSRLLCCGWLLAAAPAFGADDDAAMGRRVQELLHAHQAEIYGCVQAAPGKPAGEMLVRVVIGEGAKAASAEVLKDQSGGGPLGTCLTTKVRKWDLAALAAATGDQVVFPLVFKPEKLQKGHKRVLVPMALQDTEGPLRFVIDEETVGEAPLGTVELLSLRGDQSTPLKPRPDAEEELALYVLEGAFKLGPETLGKGDVLWLGAHTDRPALAPLDKKPLRLVEIRAHGLGSGQKVVHTAELPRYPLAGGQATAKLLLDGTGAKLAVDEIEAEAGAVIPTHKHANEDELLYFLDGTSATTVGKETYTTAPGDALRIAANSPHSVKVTDKLTVLQIYAPGGPEQRWKTADHEPPTKTKKPKKAK